MVATVEASFGSFVVGAAAALALVAYLGYKFHSASAALAAVKAELDKIEALEKSSPIVGRALDVVSRIRAIL